MPRYARRTRRVTTASALALAGFAALCPLSVAWAQQQESERPFGLFDKLFGGSERLRGGEGGERAAPTATPEYNSQDRSGLDRAAPDRSSQARTAQMSGPDMVVRVDRHENQIRQLTGIIEQLQYRNQQLEAQIRRMQGGVQEEGSPRLSSPPRPQSVPVPSSPVA